MKTKTIAGVNHFNHHLTDNDVLEIRKLYAEGGISYESLGKKYGVSRQQIYKIVKRIRWTHI